MKASHAEAEREHARQRRSNRRLRALLGGVAALLVLAVVAGAVAVSRRGEARQAALTADAQRLGTDALTRDDLEQALLLARLGVDWTTPSSPAAICSRRCYASRGCLARSPTTGR